MERDRTLRKEIPRFLVGGGLAVLTDFLGYHMFMRLGLARTPAKGLSFAGGSAAGFLVNKLWTFESKAFSKGEIARYIALYSFTACVNALVNRGALAVCPIEIAGFLAATGVSTVLNFLGQKFFVFRR